MSVAKIKFGPKSEKETGGWRKQHNEEPRNVFPSSNVVRLIRSGLIIGAGLETYERGRHTKFKPENLEEGDHLGNLGIDGIIISKYNFEI
jgi:hypothetical protein